MTLASLVVAGLIGLVAMACLRWSPTGFRQSRLLVASLAVGIGLGLSSMLYFLWVWLVGAPGAALPLTELGLLILLSGAVLRARGQPGAGLPVRDDVAIAPPKPLVLALVLCAVCAAIAFVLQSASNPQGGWDAWMTWNMHARALYRGGDRGLEVLAGLPAWSHPDYPLLLPGTVARMWTYTGRETQLASVATAMLFTFATVAVLYASVSVLRSRSQGCLAALVLLSTKFFILHGASQYADVPFGFFLLALLALLALTQHWPGDRPRLLTLAGLTLGLAAWTKNEGLLLLPTVLIGYGVVMVRAEGWAAWLRDVRAIALGLVPVLAVVVAFKLRVATGNDLMSDQGFRQTAERLLDGSRYLHVLAGLGRGALEVSLQGALGLLLLAYAVCAGPAAAGPWRLGGRAAALVLALMLAGYLAVLLTAPPELLATNVRSINRLLLQLWPSALFACFLSLRTAEEAGLFGPRPNRTEAAPGRADRSFLSLSEAS